MPKEKETDNFIDFCFYSVHKTEATQFHKDLKKETIKELENETKENKS